MVDSIIVIVSNIIFAILGMAVFVFIVARFLPFLTLKLRLKDKKLYGRGLKKIKFNEGRAIVYEPQSDVKSIILQYSLIEKNTTKYLKCKINEEVYKIEYDVVIFNSKNKIVDIVTIAEDIADRGYTKAIPLPQNTSYVEIFVRRTNNNTKKRSAKAPVAYSPLSLGIYFLSVIICSCAVTEVLKGATLNIFSLLNVEAVYTNISLLLPIIIGCICGGLVILHYTMKLNKVVRI